jgi:hypothetical protein
VHAVYDIESGGKGMDYCEVREIRFPDHLGAGHPDDQPATVRHGGRIYAPQATDWRVQPNPEPFPTSAS